MRFIRLGSFVLFSFFGFFTATALAAGAVSPDDGSLLDLFKPVVDAFRGGQYLYAGMLALVVAVAALKRYAPTKYGISDFVHGDVGGTALTLVASFGGAMATTLGAGDPFSWGIAKTAALIAVGAAGGYAMIKKLVVTPLVNSDWYKNKAPGWLKTILSLALWMFDKPDPVAAAEKAGDDAVAAKPAEGTKAVEGSITEVK